jgi:UDP-N-acetylglucosamine 4,6-dehydratase
MKIVDMFHAVSPKTKLIPSGMRPGEKLHECLVNWDESMHTRDEDWYFAIEPELFGALHHEPFEYTSENAPQLTIDEFRKDYL